ncbi:MAG: NnrS family protein [Rhodoferax sp.]|nr:NnrS family protein [Rhodoferax sp.]
MTAALPWRSRHLLLAPHRLGFFLGMVVMLAASGWWALVQWDRTTGALGLHYAISPSLVHGGVMSLGFLPLFFSGFLFTAGPKWLGVEAPTAREVLPALLLQTGGWLLWLLGAHGQGVAWLGLAGVIGGQGWMARDFWRLLLQSRVSDKLHATCIGVACVVGSLSLMGLLLSAVAGQDALALVFIQSGLWGFVVTVFVVVAHRMIPFFTSSAMPQIALWRPNWALWLMLSLVASEVLALWLAWWWQPSPNQWTGAWGLLHGSVEFAGGAALLWLAGVWGFAQSLKNRLLAMLHVGFVWLGLSWLLKGGIAWMDWYGGGLALPLGALHALTMGALASLTLAMVTRVSAGHSGRALVADTWVWRLFWLLQCATVLRLVAALPGVPSAWLLPVVASLWLVVVALWGGRLMGWYGRQRSDGRPG